MAQAEIRGLLEDGRAPSVLKAEIQEMITAAAGGGVTTEAVAKALGVAIVRSTTRPPATMHGVPTIWINPALEGALQPVPTFTLKENGAILEIETPKPAGGAMNDNL